MNKLNNQIAITGRNWAVIAGFIIAGVLSASAQTVIYYDNFPGSAQNLDNAPTTGISGLDGGASGALPQSAAYEQAINGANQLQLLDGGGGDSGYVRFDTIESPSTLYNWATSPGASAITSAGGFTVSFNWVPANNSSDWIYFCAGGDPADSFGYNYSLQVLSGNTSSGIILAGNGGVSTFNAGAGGSSGSFSPLSANAVSLTYAFTSWAAGAPVTLTASVNGTDVLSDSFNWVSGNNYLDLGTYQSQSGSLISNFEIETVPEPATWAMMLGGVGLLILSRRSLRLPA